jgi:peptidyl-prolyl cis-trans isomerase SurA
MTTQFWQKNLLKTPLAVASIFLFSNHTVNAQAQDALDDIQQIVALVNDEVISLYDLKQRSLLLMLSSRQSQVTPEQQRALQNQAMDALIDDKLKMQEAIEYESMAERTVLDTAYENYANQFNLSPEDLEEQLNLSGVQKQSLMAQINGSLSWQRVVQGLLEPQVNITDDEVFNAIDTLETNKGKDEYQVSEIFMLVTDSANKEETLTTANAIYEQLIKDVPFPAMAQQFSQSSTAAVGGDMGWVLETEIPSEVKDNILTMQIGEVSPPVEADDGIYILKVTNKRKILTVTEDDTVVDFKVLLFDKNNTTEDYISNINQKLTTNIDNLNFCAPDDDMVEKIGSLSISDVNGFVVKGLSEDVKNEILTLDIGSSTKLYEENDTLRSYVLCNKRIPEVNTPDFDNMLLSMTQTRLQLFARRHLRDLRRDAIIDYR